MTVFKGIVLFIFIVFVAYETFVITSLPSYYGTIQTKRSYIQNEIRINREQHGIPHIKANNFREATYALGYVHGIDRTWQLYLRKMSSSGRLSEVFGEQTIHIDKHIRSLGLIPSAKRIVEQLDPEAKIMLQTYADGINDGVGQLNILPLEFKIIGVQWEDWEVYDSIIFLKFLSFMNTHDAFHEFLRTQLRDLYGQEVSEVLGSIGPDNQYNKDDVVLNDEELQLFTNIWDPEGLLKGRKAKLENVTNESHSHKTVGEIFPSDLANWLIPHFGGSNIFMIHGNHTETGKSFLASDPHLETQMPCLWYYSEQIFEHEGQVYNIIGGSFAGLPAVMVGRTQYISWGCTILFSDSGDLWQEEIIEEGNKKYYRYKDELILIKTQQETLKVKGGKSVDFEVLYTHHGPVVNSDFFTPKNRKNNTYYSLQTVSLIDDAEGINVLFKFNLRKTVKEALEDLKIIHYPNLGMGLASADEIGYIGTGRIPIREGNPDNFGYVKEGWTGAHEWIGYGSYEAQPKSLNPPKGFIVSANNKYMGPNNKYNFAWGTYPTSRAQRINEIITQKIKQNHKFSMEDVKRIQNDIVDTYARDSIPPLLKLIDYSIQIHNYNKKQLESLKVIKEILQNYNGSTDRESVGTSLYGKFEYFYTRKFMKEIQEIDFNGWSKWSCHYLYDCFSFKNIQEMAQAIEGDDKTIFSKQWCISSEKTYPCLFNLVDSLILAYQSLVKQFGSNPSKWQWSKLHTHYLPHMPFKDTPLSYIFDRKFPYSGNRRVVHQSEPSLEKENEFITYQAPNLKFLADMSENGKSYIVLDTGISGNVLSEHYDDLLKMFENGEYLEVKMGDQHFNEDKRYRQILRPKSTKTDI